MTYQIECPVSHQPTYFAEPSDCQADDCLEGLCTRSRYKYAVVFATVEHCRTERAPSTSASRRPRWEAYTYDLRILKSNGSVAAVRFGTENTEPFSAVTGDRLVLLYLVRNGQLDKLIRIDNLTTGQQWQLHSPNAGVLKRAGRASAWTLTIGLGAAAVAAAVMDASFATLAIATVIPATVGVGIGVKRWIDPKVRDRQELARLQAEQALLARQFELESKKQTLEREAATHRKLVNRLKSLHRQMADTDRELYAKRLTVVKRAIKTLTEGLSLTQSLIDGYGRVVSVLAIEYETSRLADHLPDDVTSTVLARLEELRELEARREELEAMVDPQRLLREVGI